LALKIEIFALSTESHGRNPTPIKSTGESSGLLFFHCLKWLSVAMKVGGLHVQVALLRIIFEWVRDCPEAIQLVLGARSLFLFELLCEPESNFLGLTSSNLHPLPSKLGGKSEMVHCHGLTALIIGTCLVYMDGNNTKSSKNGNQI
jgi:hypothetical protein